MIVHLEAEPTRISTNRLTDQSRSRPTYGLEILRQHQDISREHAKSIATELVVEFQSVTHDGASDLACVLKT